MSKNVLEVIFGTKLRVRILKFLFRNPEKAFTISELAVLVQEEEQKVLDEIQTLCSINLIKIKH